MTHAEPLQLGTVLDKLLEVNRRFMVITAPDGTQRVAVWSPMGGYVVDFDASGSLLATAPRGVH